MTSHELILAAAAGAVCLAICATLWALAQRRRFEARLAVLQGRLADPAFYQGAAEAVRETQARLAKLDAEIDEALVRWESLESKP